MVWVCVGGGWLAVFCEGVVGGGGVGGEDLVAEFGGEGEDVGGNFSFFFSFFGGLDGGRVGSG